VRIQVSRSLCRKGLAGNVDEDSELEARTSEPGVQNRARQRMQSLCRPFDVDGDIHFHFARTQRLQRTQERG